MDGDDIHPVLSNQQFMFCLYMMFLSEERSGNASSAKEI